jgi:hypothetical protein
MYVMQCNPSTLPIVRIVANESRQGLRLVFFRGSAGAASMKQSRMVGDAG